MARKGMMHRSMICELLASATMQPSIGRGREEKSRREKIREEKESEERRCRCAKR